MHLNVPNRHVGVLLMVAFSLFHAALPEFLLLLGTEWRGVGLQEVTQLILMRVLEDSPPYQILFFGILFGMVDVVLAFGLFHRRSWVPRFVRFSFPVLAIVSLLSMGWALTIMYWLESQVRLEYGLPQFFYIAELFYSTELRITFFWGLVGVIFASTMLWYQQMARNRSKRVN